jgi:hypothetical protein
LYIDDLHDAIAQTYLPGNGGHHADRKLPVRRRRLRGRRPSRTHRPLPLPDLPQDPRHGLLVGDIPRERFRWTRGQDRLGAIESSPGKFRRFCTKCGSHVIAERMAQPVVLLRLGCLDTPVTDRPQVHIWRSDAAPWYDPKQQFPEKPEGLT